MPQTTTTTHNGQSTPPARRTMSGPKLAALLVSVVAIIGIGTFAATSGDDSDESSDSTAVPAVEWRPVVIDGPDLAPYDPDLADPAVGSVAPIIRGASFTAEPTDIKPGKPTLVVVVAHWCPHCQAEVPRLVEWSKSGAVPAGLDIIGLATSTDRDAPNFPPSRWLNKEGFPWKVIADNEQAVAAQALGVTGFPFFVMIDADGKVAWRASGELAPTELQDMLEGVLLA